MISVSNRFTDSILSPNLCIAVRVDPDTITFISGTLHSYRLKKEILAPNPVATPEFDLTTIVDWGQTIAFGSYEVAFDYVMKVGDRL